MITEKILFRKGRVSVHFVKPRKGGMKYFDCFYLIPTLLTYTINTHSHEEKYLFTRFTGIQFLWWSVEVGVKYGKEEEESMPGFSRLEEAVKKFNEAVRNCGLKIRVFNTHRANITIMNHDLTHCSGIWYDENDEPKVCERRQECHRYEAWLALEQDEKHLPKGYIIPFLKGEECVRTGYSQMWTREHSGNQHDETDVFEHVSSGMGVDDEKEVEKVVRKGGEE